MLGSQEDADLLFLMVNSEHLIAGMFATSISIKKKSSYFCCKTLLFLQKPEHQQQQQQQKQKDLPSDGSVPKYPSQWLELHQLKSKTWQDLISHL